MTESRRLLGSVEAGGTKFVCAVGDEDYRIIDTTTFPTTDPVATIEATISYFKQFPELAALSIASFGPVDIRRTSPTYGYITNTPKYGWKNIDFVGPVAAALHVPIEFTTDVNGSAFGEYTMANLFNEKISSLTYLTIGTGVGGGAIIDGKLVGQQGHPEMGHVFVKRHPDDLEYVGGCPFHQDCLEGLAAGPTIAARLGIRGEDVPANHAIWDILSYYIAQAVIQQTLILRPDCIVLGGGVMSEQLIERVRRDFSVMNADYVKVPDLAQYLRLPRVVDNGSATVGNFALALAQLK